MADGNQVRSVRDRPRVEADQRRALKKYPYVSLYTRFERGGIYRFRSIDQGFRPIYTAAIRRRTRLAAP